MGNNTEQECSIEGCSTKRFDKVIMCYPCYLAKCTCASRGVQRCIIARDIVSIIQRRQTKKETLHLLEKLFIVFCAGVNIVNQSGIKEQSHARRKGTLPASSVAGRLMRVASVEGTIATYPEEITAVHVADAGNTAPA